MLQVPAEIWNEIAQMPSMRTATGKKLFSMNQDEMTDALERQAKLLAKAGRDPKLIAAYQEIYPILMEREAISDYLQKTGRLELRGALPDVETPAEAVTVATMEHGLTEKQASELLGMLERLP